MGHVHPSCKGAHQLLLRSQSNTYFFQYFTKYKQKSLDSYDFKSTLIEFFASDSAASKSLNELDWDSWFYNPGFPPKPNFDTSLVDVCYKLADRWEALAEGAGKNSFEPKKSDIAGWTANQVVVFLEKVQDFARLLKKDDVELMGERYGFATSQNVEVVSRYFRVGLRAKDPGVYGPTAELLGRVGRMKFVRPL
jgi:leukotriene-A4 hydrolase